MGGWVLGYLSERAMRAHAERYCIFVVWNIIIVLLLFFYFFYGFGILIDVIEVIL
jgi:hypothetical protein